MTTQPVSGVPATPNGNTPARSAQPLADKHTFLQLLVAQLKHQDPLNPADGLQFVTQLAQFTSLEQTMEIRKELEAIREALTAASTTNPGQPPATNP
jgi:flagellar basal-body rod modification protein FlgD